MLSTIQSLARSYKARKIVVLSDKYKSKYRREIHPEYKANRSFDLLSEQEKADKKALLESYEEYWKEVIEPTLPSLRFEYVEADDLAAYIVKNVKDKFNHVWLISTDGDWDLLLDKNVSRFSTKTRKEYTLENMYENHGCDTPQEFAMLKCLTTDTSDNIPGYPNVGEKRAYTIVKGMESIFDLYDSLPLAGKQKFIATINNDPELMIKNAKLTDLLNVCEFAIAFPNHENIDVVNKFIKERILDD